MSDLIHQILYNVYIFAINSQLVAEQIPHVYWFINEKNQIVTLVKSFHMWLSNLLAWNSQTVKVIRIVK